MSATTVAKILDLMNPGSGLLPCAVTISPIEYRGGVPYPDAEYSAPGATLSIEWVDTDPECGPYLCGCVHVANPLRDQGIDDDEAAAMIQAAYERRNKPAEPKPAEPDTPVEDLPF